jgi:tripartite-type tricarboxylate transporter receptor subunit TctC
MGRWIAFACAVALGFTASARAEIYPSRPITVIVPFAAGGPTDTLMRVLAEPMRAALGPPREASASPASRRRRPTATR